MEKILSPETIYSGVKSEEISKDVAVDQLISLIEGSNVPKTRSISMLILNKLKIRNPRIFKITESSILSDESPFVRGAALNLIGSQFLKQGLEILKWVVRHEKSPLVIKSIFDLNLDFTDTQLKPLKKELTDYLAKIALSVGVIDAEAKFILDLEALFANILENYKLELDSYKNFTELKDQKSGEFWLTIKNQHIESLNFNYFNWLYIKRNPDLFNSISSLYDPDLYLNLLRKLPVQNNLSLLIPESISLLTNLKKLNLKRNRIRELPKSLFLLPNLEFLDLSYNMLSEIPEEITNFKSLATLRIHNNHIRHVSKLVSDYLGTLTKYKI